MKNKIMLLILLLVSARGACAFISTINTSPINYSPEGLNLISGGNSIYSLIGNYTDQTTDNYYGFVVQFDSNGNSINIGTTSNYQFYGGISKTGGYTVLAQFLDDPDESYYSSVIMQLDAGGDCTSVRALNNESFESGGICGTPDGGLVAGVDDYGTNDYLYIERQNSAGNSVWANVYNYEATIDKITAATDGGYFIAGALDGAPFLMKLDSAGNKLWDWEDPKYGEFLGILGIENGSAIAVGCSYTDSSETNMNMLAVKIGQTGKQVWRKENDWSDIDYARDINLAAGERLGYILSGASDGITGSGYLNIYAMQIDSDGNTSNLQNITVPYAARQGFNAAISADHFILAGVDYPGDIFIADYNPVVYTSAPVAGGISSDNFYVCPQPAKDHVKFVYALQDRATIKINIYNFANRLVGQSVTTELPADNVTTQVDTTKLKSGVYFYQIIENSGGKEKRLKSGEFIIKK